MSATVWVSEHNAFTGALAWSFRNDGFLQIQTDYLIHYDLSKEIEQDIKGGAYFHYGIGGRLRDDTSDNRMSIRAPARGDLHTSEGLSGRFLRGGAYAGYRARNRLRSECGNRCPIFLQRGHRPTFSLS